MSRDTAESSTAPPAKEKSVSTGSILGGVALVGAAAGYALLALRFRNFSSTANNASRFSSGSAEMRAADAFTKEWVRSVEKPGAEGMGQGAFRGQQQQQQQQQQQSQTAHAHLSVDAAPPAWALKEFGLPENAAVSLSAAKSAYRERAKLLHPDAPGGGNEAAFKQLTKAFEAVEAKLPPS